LVILERFSAKTLLFEVNQVIFSINHLVLFFWVTVFQLRDLIFLFLAVIPLLIFFVLILFLNHDRSLAPRDRPPWTFLFCVDFLGAIVVYSVKCIPSVVNLVGEILNLGVRQRALRLLVAFP